MHWYGLFFLFLGGVLLLQDELYRDEFVPVGRLKRSSSFDSNLT